MPKSRKPKTYSIDELSPEAKERALQAFREGPHSVDEFDADSLTDSFEEFLEEKGIEEASVNWTLGYSQGDGVCFSGRIQIRDVIFLNELKQFNLLAELFMNHLFTARVEKGRSRDCHWNSMHIETMLHVERDYFLSAAETREFDRAISEHAKVIEEWKRVAGEIHKRNIAPIIEWQKAFDAWEDQVGGGPREWNPRLRHPGEKPDPLNEPTPAAPRQILPRSLADALETADGQVKKAEVMTVEFEEWLGEWIKGLSRTMEKNGYSEIEYRDSEEVIVDYMTAHAWKFQEDGQRAPR